MEFFNIAQPLAEQAKTAPDRAAIVFPAGRDNKGRSKFLQWTFSQLNELCDQYAHGLAGIGIKQGDRTLMMVKPGIDLIALTFALLKIGAVPVLIDPGMGRKAFLQCVSDCRPVAMVGIPAAHLIRLVFSRPFRTINKFVTLGKKRFWQGFTLDEIRSDSRDSFPVANTTVDNEAAIAFTSGGTGIPKGVIYTHGIFKAQIEIMQNEMHVSPGEIHLSVMYIFALFNPALGVTTIIPDMDPRKTAQVNPAWLVESIQTFGVTMSLGSPLIWQKLYDYCQAQQIKLPMIKHVFMFGDAVPPQLVKKFKTITPVGKVYTPYGATEALPLTLIEENEIEGKIGQASITGAGVCVGRPIGGLEIKIIKITDQVVESWNDELLLPNGQIGEIVIRGKVVTREYVNRPDQTRLAKISDPKGIWHRMGDLGYLDGQGLLWVCGRKSHRVVTATQMLLPIPCEMIFNQHPDVKRTALIGIGPIGKQKPVLVVEMLPEKRSRSKHDRQQLIKELISLGSAFDHTREIKEFLFHDSFPVDVRHNTKIQRELLAQWAKKHIKSINL